MNIVHKMPNRQPVAITPVFDMPLDAGFMTGVTIQDLSLNQNHGDAVNSPVFTNPGMQFVDASTQKVGPIVGPTTVKTISLWVNLDGLGANEGILRLNGTDRLRIASSVISLQGFSGGTTILYLDSVVGTSGVTAVTAEWHHIAITTTLGKNASDLEIGHETTSVFTTGKIGDVRMYAEVLTPSQIQSIFNIQRYKYGV